MGKFMTLSPIRARALWGALILTTSCILVFPSLALNRLRKGPSTLLSKPRMLYPLSRARSQGHVLRPVTALTVHQGLPVNGYSLKPNLKLARSYISLSRASTLLLLLSSLALDP